MLQNAGVQQTHMPWTTALLTSVDLPDQSTQLCLTFPMAARLIAVRFAYLQYNILEMSYKKNSVLYAARKV